MALRSSPKIFDTENFRLVHGNSAGDLLEIFAAGDLHQQLFDLAELALGGKLRRVGGKGFQRIHIGCKPGQAMGLVLVLVKSRGDACRPKHRALTASLAFSKTRSVASYRFAQCFNHRSCPYFVQSWTLSQVFVQRNMKCRNWAGFLWPMASDRFFYLLRLCN